MDQKTLIEVVLGIIVPILTAVFAAYGWSPVAKVWLKFAFSVVGALLVMFFGGQLVGLKLPPLSDPTAFLTALGGIVSVVFTLAVIIYQLIGERVQGAVVRLRQK